MENEVKNDLSQKYSKTSIITHWLTFLLIIALFISGFMMSKETFILKKIHFLSGYSILLLTLIRITAIKCKRPSPLMTGSPLNDKLIIWTHYLLYTILMLLPLSGILIINTRGTTGIINTIHKIAEETHIISVPVLLILIALHIMGTIKHYILTKENTLKRII